MGKALFQKLGKILKNFGKFLKKLGKFFKKFTKFLRFAEAKLKSREVLKAKLGSKAKPCYTLLFFEYKIKCAMLKNAMFFILAVFSLSGCTNYSRPEKIALQKSDSPYPPPYRQRHANRNISSAKFKPHRSRRFRQFLGAFRNLACPRKNDSRPGHGTCG